MSCSLYWSVYGALVQAEKIERKRLEKLYDPHPASLSLPAEVARELQEAMHGLDRRGRNLDFYNPDVAVEGESYMSLVCSALASVGLLADGHRIY